MFSTATKPATFIPLQKDMRFTSQVVQQQPLTPAQHFNVLAQHTDDSFIQSNRSDTGSTCKRLYIANGFNPPVFMPSQKNGHLWPNFQGQSDTISTKQAHPSQTRWIT
jgi:hypothetical protein